MDNTTQTQEHIVSTLNQHSLGLYREYIKKFLVLPQSKHFSDSAIKQWLSILEARGEHQSIDWHIKRLSGIGGSESFATAQIMALEQGELPEFDPFGRVDKLVRQKLLLEPPLLRTTSMQRGIDLEPIIKKMSLELLDAKERNDLKMMTREQSGKIKEHEWLIGSPDLIAETHDGKIILADLKVPENASQKIPERYVYQLHHYAILYYSIEKKFPDHLMCLQYDWSKHQIVVETVDIDKSILKTIIEGGDRLWNEYILEGIVPEIPRTVEKTIDPEVIAKIERLYARYKTLDESISLLKTLIESEINGLMKKYTPKELNQNTSMVRFSERVSIADEERVKRLLEERGVDLKEVSTPGTLDEAKIERFFKEQGLNLDDFRQTKFDAKKVAELIDDEEAIKKTPVIAAKNAKIITSLIPDAGAKKQDILLWAYAADELDVNKEEEHEISSRGPSF